MSPRIPPFIDSTHISFHKINAAGKRWLELIKSQWNTKTKVMMTAKRSNFTIRGFHGDYDVIVRYRGKPIQMSHFSVDGTDVGKVINVNVSGDGRKCFYAFIAN